MKLNQKACRAALGVTYLVAVMWPTFPYLWVLGFIYLLWAVLG